MNAASNNGIGMTSMRTRKRLIDRLRRHGIRSEAVLAALEATPRHLFVGEALAHKAYEDTALPIGHQQTISQPWVVARMTELLLEGGETPKRVLEIGTGCGYQTAILSQLSRWVFTIERIGALLEQARERLQAIGFRNISYLHGDGFEGWPSNSPFDGILVAAAPIGPRLLGSLSPPQPNTHQTWPRQCSRAAASALPSAAGVCAGSAVEALANAAPWRH